MDEGTSLATQLTRKITKKNEGKTGISESRRMSESDTDHGLVQGGEESGDRNIGGFKVSHRLLFILQMEAKQQPQKQEHITASPSRRHLLMQPQAVAFP